MMTLKKSKNTEIMFSNKWYQKSGKVSRMGLSKYYPV